MSVAVVIFGASGDLTRRKLMPALYNLAVSRSLPSAFAVVGVARREKSTEGFRAEMREGLGKVTSLVGLGDEPPTKKPPKEE